MRLERIVPEAVSPAFVANLLSHASMLIAACPFPLQGITALLVIPALAFSVVFTTAGLGGNVYLLLLLREFQSDHVNPWEFAQEVHNNLRLELVLHAPIVLCLLGAGTPTSLCAILISAALRLRAHARGEYMLDTTKVRRACSPRISFSARGSPSSFDASELVQILRARWAGVPVQFTSKQSLRGLGEPSNAGPKVCLPALLVPRCWQVFRRDTVRLLRCRWVASVLLYMVILVVMIILLAFVTTHLDRKRPSWSQG